ncbi:MAG: rhamnogalacturonan acetylesterase [Alkalibacterium sp.]|nr:rhamnogalacturonan acetylesterase [Alkalibacterium sp.]
MINIYIAGDSTAAEKLQEEKPMSGWGEHIGAYFNNSVIVHNHAKNGRSTKSFKEQKRFDEILSKITPGDYVLIQFGHNDQKSDDPKRYTDPFDEYKKNLSYYIKETKARQANPVLLTSVTRRQFIGGSLSKHTLGDYPDAMRETAHEKEVVLIDMYSLTSSYIDRQGDEQSKQLFLHLKPGECSNYPDGLVDNTHFSIEGAKIIAELTAKEIMNQISELRERKNVMSKKDVYK